MDFFEDELSNTVAGLDFKVRVTKVEEDHTHVASVVRVDDSRANINEFLVGKARPGNWQSCASE